MGQYSINFYKDGERRAADWNWMEKGWAQSDFEGVTWIPRSLSEDGRQAILKHFQIPDDGESPTILSIKNMPPAHLLAWRRKIESERGLTMVYPVSNRMGDHIGAELVAA